MSEEKKTADPVPGIGSTEKTANIVLTIAELAILIAAIVAMCFSKVDLYQSLVIFYLLCFKAHRK